MEKAVMEGAMMVMVEGVMIEAVMVVTKEMVRVEEVMVEAVMLETEGVMTEAVTVTTQETAMAETVMVMEEVEEVMVKVVTEEVAEGGGTYLPPSTVAGVSPQPGQVGAKVSYRNGEDEWPAPALQHFCLCPSFQCSPAGRISCDRHIKSNTFSHSQISRGHLQYSTLKNI